jgi:uncharacterized OB-fold protein
MRRINAVSDVAPRPLPEVNEMNEHFWHGGADGRLHLLRCGGCGYYIHPYAPICVKCRSRDVTPQPVSGRGTIIAITVNHQPWFPAVPVPYVIALVQLEEQANLRLVTNLRNCAVADTAVGMPVSVCFEQHDDIYVPLFEPATS